MTWEEFLALSDGEQEIKGLAALRETVAEAGEDFIYRDVLCAYVTDGTPACLIAQAATKLGASISTLLGWDGLEQGDITNVAISLNYPISERLITAWATAQSQQDRRATWGEALRRAEVVLR